MARSKDGIVITGCGWVTPAITGNIAEVLPALSWHHEAGKVRFGSHQANRVDDAILEQYPHFRPELLANKAAWMVAIALERACRDASLVINRWTAERTGILLGSAWAGTRGMVDFANDVREQSARFVSPLHFPQTVGNFVTGVVARSYDIRGPTATIAGDETAGLSAIGEAISLLHAGQADLFFAGGVDCASEINDPSLTMGGGFQASEGACLLLLEREERAAARGARALAFVADGPDDGFEARVLSVVHLPGEGERNSKHGVVSVGHWTEPCWAVMGAAAVAAGIGAAVGLPVPISGADGLPSTSVLPPDDDSDGEITLAIMPSVREASQRTLRLSVPCQRTKTDP